MFQHGWKDGARGGGQAVPSSLFNKIERMLRQMFKLFAGAFRFMIILTDPYVGHLRDPPIRIKTIQSLQLLMSP